jgi:curved DNA-binding protein CbpA
MNFYEALNLPPSATTEEIEEAYRTLARKVHPDLNRHDPTPAEARMKLLNRIRDTLTDPELVYSMIASWQKGPTLHEWNPRSTRRFGRAEMMRFFWRRVKLTTAGGLAVGLLLGLGSWFLDLTRSRQPQPAAAAKVEVPIPVAAPSVPSLPKPVPAVPRTTKKTETGSR